jgi:uncharacterized membrane protein
MTKRPGRRGVFSLGFHEFWQSVLVWLAAGEFGGIFDAEANMPLTLSLRRSGSGRMCLSVATAAMLFACAAGSPAFGQTFTLLGVKPGYQYSLSTAVVDDGSLTVGYSVGQDRSQESFVSSDGIRTDLPSDQDYYGVSGDGAFLLGYSNSSIVRQRRSDGAVRTVAIPNFYTNGYNSFGDINRTGSVVVGYSVSSSGLSSKAWYWTEGSVATQIVTGGSWSKATGVSADGRYVCGYDDGGFGSAFLYDRQLNSSRWLQGDALFNHANAFAISGDGRVVVGRAFDSRGIETPVRWVDGALDYLILNSTITDDGVATDVSLDGSVITGGFFNSNRGFVWTPGTGLLDARDFLALCGVSLSTDIRIGRDLYVSADGKTLAGYAYTTQPSVLQAFVATIPVPGAMSFALAVAGFGLRRRR